MSAKRPTAQDIVSWYFQPSLATQTPTPRTPYNHPVTSLQESIRLTLRYLTAATPAIDHGHIRPIRGRDGKQTLFWSIYEVRQDVKIETPEGGVRTQMTILYYGFDASGKLALETVASQSFESQYNNGYSWPDSSAIPTEHHDKLLEKLEKFRKKLARA